LFVFQIFFERECGCGLEEYVDGYTR
jgi:hypothetical protein